MPTGINGLKSIMSSTIRNSTYIVHKTCVKITMWGRHFGLFTVRYLLDSLVAMKFNILAFIYNNRQFLCEISRLVKYCKINTNIYGIGIALYLLLTYTFTVNRFILLVHSNIIWFNFHHSLWICTSWNSVPFKIKWNIVMFIIRIK